MSLRDLIRSISPTWLQDGIAEKYLYSAALVLDGTVDRVQQGVQGAMPEKCDPSFLPYIGRDRSTVRGISESDASFASRCKTAIYDWHFAGISGGVIQAVLGYLTPAAPMIRIVWSATGGWLNPTQWAWTPDGAPREQTPESISNLGASPYWCTWIWDGIANRRRFWLILYVNSTGAPWINSGTHYGDGRTYGNGHLYGVGGITAAQIETMRGLVKTWKAAHSRCEWIVVSFDPAMFDPLYTGDLPGANGSLPDGNWGSDGKDDGLGNYIYARDVNARYIPGVG